MYESSGFIADVYLFSFQNAKNAEFLLQLYKYFINWVIIIWFVETTHF